MEECDGNRKCICTGGYTGAHCENTLPVEILRKKLNRKLSFVLILSMYVNPFDCGCRLVQIPITVLKIIFMCANAVS